MGLWRGLFNLAGPGAIYLGIVEFMAWAGALQAPDARPAGVDIYGIRPGVPTEKRHPTEPVTEIESFEIELGQSPMWGSSGHV